MKAFLTLMMIMTTWSVAQSQPMNFFAAENGGTCQDDCSWIAAEGDITSDTPAAFRKYLIESFHYPYLHINSQGGDLSAGVELGRLFRENHLSIRVSRTVKNPDFKYLFMEDDGGVCVSACAYAFIGGEIRDADEGQIGIHQFSASLTNSGKEIVAVKKENGVETRTILSTAQAAAAYLIQYVNDMGVDSRFVALASATQAVYSLKKSEMDLFKVRWQPKEFSPWGIEPWGKGIIASSKTRDGKVGAYVYCYADKRPHFQITALGSQNELEQALESSQHFSVFGQDIDGTSVDVKTINGTVVLRMDLKAIDPKTIKSLDSIFVWDGTNNVSSYFAYKPIPLEGAADNISVALKNCSA